MASGKENSDGEGDSDSSFNSCPVISHFSSFQSQQMLDSNAEANGVGMVCMVGMAGGMMSPFPPSLVPETLIFG